jgi:polyisoprenoid-binding protein YceI
MDDHKDFTAVTAQELKGWMAAGKDLALIDVLPGERYARKHLPGALNACVYEVMFGAQVATLIPDSNRPVVVYGFSSATRDAVTAAEKLARLGYQRVAALAGGVVGWKAAGYPLEGEDLDAPDTETTTVELEDRPYRVDVDQSLIEWAGRNANNKNHGTVRLAQGEIVVHEDDVTGSVEIDMHSIMNINIEDKSLRQVLLDHLKSDDFFYVAKFPRASFAIRKVRRIKDATLGTPNAEIQGDLSLRGVSAELSFAATVARLEDGGFTAEAHFDIDRTRWGVDYGSGRYFEHLGMHLVFDPISIQIRLVAR